MIYAFQALPQLRDQAKFAGWLFAIARNRAVRVAQRESFDARRRVDSEHLLHLASPAEDSDWLSAGVHQLPEEFARPAVLHYLEGWPISLIAESLGDPVTTVKWRLHRARQILRQRHGALEEN